MMRRPRGGTQRRSYRTKLNGRPPALVRASRAQAVLAGRDFVDAVVQAQAAVFAEDEGLVDGDPAFDTGAVDYVLKPVDDERLAQTLMRLKARLAQPAAPDTAAQSPHPAP